MKKILCLLLISALMPIDAGNANQKSKKKKKEYVQKKSDESTPESSLEEKTPTPTTTSKPERFGARQWTKAYLSKYKTLYTYAPVVDKRTGRSTNVVEQWGFEGSPAEEACYCLESGSNEIHFADDKMYEIGCDTVKRYTMTGERDIQTTKFERSIIKAAASNAGISVWTKDNYATCLTPDGELQYEPVHLRPLMAQDFHSVLFEDKSCDVNAYYQMELLETGEMVVVGVFDSNIHIIDKFRKHVNIDKPSNFHCIAPKKVNDRLVALGGHETLAHRSKVHLLSQEEDAANSFFTIPHKSLYFDFDDTHFLSHGPMDNESMVMMLYDLERGERTYAYEDASGAEKYDVRLEYPLVYLLQHTKKGVPLGCGDTKITCIDTRQKPNEN